MHEDSVLFLVFLIFSGKLIAINVEARQNYRRFCNFINITPALSQTVLWNDQRVANARLLFEAGRMPALTFVQWCRTSVRDTLAVVRQGRRLLRYLKAQEAELQYDDVATSSDSSVAR